MGLDTSHDCWHGPYSAFTRWRLAVAEAAGYTVWPVTYENGMAMNTVMIDWGHIMAENPDALNGEWRTVPADPLLYLIVHQDCEGVIHPQHAAPLADRLESLLDRIPETGRGEWERLRDKTVLFIAGLRDAATKGEDVEFH